MKWDLVVIKDGRCIKRIEDLGPEIARIAKKSWQSLEGTEVHLIPRIKIIRKPWWKKLWQKITGT